MVVKDSDVNENIDRDKTHKTGEDRPVEKANPAQQGSADAAAQTEVKNAHATGDGSYGRNDGSISEDDEEEQAGENIY